MIFEKLKRETGSLDKGTNDPDIFIKDLFDSTLKTKTLFLFDEDKELLIDISTDAENQINDYRLAELEKNITHEFLHYLAEEDFEYGVTSKSELLVKEQMKKNSLATKEWLNRLFIKNFGKPQILIGILRVIARLDEDEMNPQGQILALAALSHKNTEVRECAIRAYESWGSINSLNSLKNVQVEPDWLQEYLEEMIEDLKAEL